MSTNQRIGSAVASQLAESRVSLSRCSGPVRTHDLVGRRVGVRPTHVEHEPGLELPQVEHRRQVLHLGAAQAMTREEVRQRLAAAQRIGGLDGVGGGIGGGNGSGGTRRWMISKPQLASAEGERQ